MDDEVDGTWVAMKVNKALTNRRYTLNQLIDKGHAKPPELSDAAWNKLVKRRTSCAAKVTSERMADVSKGKKGTNRPKPAAMREQAVMRLVRCPEMSLQMLCLMSMMISKLMSKWMFNLMSN